MQAVRQVVSADGLQDRGYQFSRHRLHFRISSRSARLAEKHYKSKHVLSGIVEKGVMVGFYITHGDVFGVPSPDSIALELRQYFFVLNIRYQRTRYNTSAKIGHLFGVAIVPL